MKKLILITLIVTGVALNIWFLYSVGIMQQLLSSPWKGKTMIHAGDSFCVGCIWYERWCNVIYNRRNFGAKKYVLARL